MVKTEALRYILDSEKGIHPPKDVVDALHKLDSALEAVWNDDDGQWEIYRVKQKGVIPNQDLLHWQMSAPVKGTNITASIVDWLKKYDSSAGGKFSKDELKDQWLKQWKEIQYNEVVQKEKKENELYYSWQEMIDKIGSARKQIAVPITVGFNKKTGKNIRAFQKPAKSVVRQVKIATN